MLHAATTGRYMHRYMHMRYRYMHMRHRYMRLRRHRAAHLHVELQDGRLHLYWRVQPCSLQPCSLIGGRVRWAGGH